MNEHLCWYGCYKHARVHDQFFTKESGKHPAKMNARLLQQIRRFGENQAWWGFGDTIIDPFYGIGTTGLMRLHGYNVIGVELEEPFVEMAQDNAELIDQRASWIAGKGWCIIVQGDSRQLVGLLEGSGDLQGAITSPPYTDITLGQTEAQVKRRIERLKAAGYDADGMVGAPGSGRHEHSNLGKIPAEYGKAEGQIGGMVDAVLTSPPYANRMDGGPVREGYESMRPYDFEGDPAGYKPRSKGSAQIGSLDDRYADGAVTSPPYGDTMRRNKPEHTNIQEADPEMKEKRLSGIAYGQEEGQIGNLQEVGVPDEGKETYQSAMLQCYDQLFLCLKSGGVACVVTKNPTRDKKLRRLDVDTAWLLLSAGFELWCPICDDWDSVLHAHEDDELEPIVGYRAVLFEETIQGALFDTVEDLVPDWENAIPVDMPCPGMGWKPTRCPSHKALRDLYGDDAGIPKHVRDGRTYWVQRIPRGQVQISGRIAKGRMSYFKRLSYNKGQPVARWEDVIFARKPKCQG